MGAQRNGARTFLVFLAKLCKFYRMPGFTVGLAAILGAEQASEVRTLFDPLCNLVDSLVAADNYFNQKDAQDDDGTGEDAAGEPA